MKLKNERSKTNWQTKQDELAEKSGLAIVLTDSPGLSMLAESNNNSICEILTKSDEFAPQCEKFCGKVFENAVATGKSLKYKCYAGLQCIAVPFRGADEKQFVAITGRTFTKSDEYRTATERAITGDWSKFPPTKVFANVLMTSSFKTLENLAEKIADLSDEDKQLLPKRVSINEAKADELIENSVTENQLAENKTSNETEDDKITKSENPPMISGSQAESAKIAKKNQEEANEIAEWRSLFNSLLKSNYNDACLSILEFLKTRYRISSIAWLENIDNKLHKKLAIGKLKNQEIQISIAMDDEGLLKLIGRESSIELREKNKENNDANSGTIRLFPVFVGGEIRSGLVIGEKADDKAIEQSITKFCQTVASELEILRLREELSKRSWLDVALQKFNESLKMIDAEDFWSRLMQTTAELLQAERGSILVFNEKVEELVVKAAIGSEVDLLKQENANVGKRVARKVWESGEPLVVPSITNLSLEPSDRKYKTESFISFPISIGQRKIGVLNVADKVDGTPYQEFDLQLLQSIIPQIAMAIDHATLKNKAGEFQQLSVTDPLTGLLNRRYLEERLDEEIKRSNRHGFPMSFMMIDVDDFKSYNDKFLHPEGDKALQIVGQCLRETLRGADIASRYGGEEFSILLPQTTLDEAEIIAERIRNNIATTKFPHRQVTVSIGIACISLAINSVEDLIASADKALFEAKHQGKNNVQIFEDQKHEIRLPS